VVCKKTTKKSPDTFSLELTQLPTPALKWGDVLIKVIASPINPSDRLFIKCLYGHKPVDGQVPGFEGCGIVVAHNAGPLGNRLMGCRVSGATQGGNGFWAEYVKLSVFGVIKMPQDISEVSAACAFVNPLSAWGLFEPVHNGRYLGIVQNAAASQLGRMIIRLGKRYNKPVVNIVHRAALVDELKQKEGAKIVLCSSAADFPDVLKETVSKLNIHYGIDAVGGPSTLALMQALPSESTVVNYGLLSLQPPQADPMGLIFQKKILQGFWLSDWLSGKGVLAPFVMKRILPARLRDDFQSFSSQLVSLKDLTQDLDELCGQTSLGKTIVNPNLA
jgi:NADPH2:quinone reductase